MNWMKKNRNRNSSEFRNFWSKKNTPKQFSAKGNSFNAKELFDFQTSAEHMVRRNYEEVWIPFNCDEVDSNSSFFFVRFIQSDDTSFQKHLCFTWHRCTVPCVWMCVCVDTVYTSVERKRECVSRMHHELEVVFCFSLIVSFESLFFHLSALSVLLVGCRSAEIVGVGSKCFLRLHHLNATFSVQVHSVHFIYVCWIWFRPLWKYFGWFLWILGNLLNSIYSNENCFVFQFILVDFNRLKKNNHSSLWIGFRILQSFCTKRSW